MRSSRRIRCRPNGRQYTHVNARWFKDKAAARAPIDEWKPVD